MGLKNRVIILFVLVVVFWSCNTVEKQNHTSKSEEDTVLVPFKSRLLPAPLDGGFQMEE